MTEDEPLEPGQPLKVGSHFLCVTEENGKSMEFKGVVTEHNEPKLHTVEMTGQMFDIEARYVFEELGPKSTRLTQHSDVRGKGFVKLIFLLVGWMMYKQGCQQAQKELENLKRILEEKTRRQRPADEG